jgi:hypothetical protein
MERQLLDIRFEKMSQRFGSRSALASEANQGRQL